MYEDLIHKSTEYLPMVKFYHLMGMLEPNSPPYWVVCGFQRTPENYETAWKALCDRYDDDRRIIDSHLQKFFEMRSLDQPTRAGITNIINQTNHLVLSLPPLGVEVKYWDPILVYIILSKLDPDSRRAWSMERTSKKAAVLAPLLTFLESRASGADELKTVVRARNYNQNNNARAPAQQTPTSNTPPIAPTVNQNQQRERLKCFLCPQEVHRLYSCPKFRAMAIRERLEKVKNLRLCAKCLRKAHGNCSMRPCQCGGQHNSFLCLETAPVVNAAIAEERQGSINPVLNRSGRHGTISSAQSQSSAISTETEKQANARMGEQYFRPIQNNTIVEQPIESKFRPALINAIVDKPAESNLLGTVVVAASDNKGRVQRLRGLCDNASQLSFITENTVQRLRQKKISQHVTVQGFGGVDTLTLNGEIILDLSSIYDHSVTVRVRLIVIQKIMGRLPTKSFETKSWRMLDDLNLADPNFSVPGEIDILLGMDVWCHIVMDGLKRINEMQPIALKTCFGWVIQGKIDVAPRLVAKCHNVTDVISKSDQLAELIQRFWVIEEPPHRRYLTVGEEKCEQIFTETVGRNEVGRYIVKLPFMTSPPPLGNSYNIALKQFLRLEQKLKKNPAMYKEYSDFMGKYETRTHVTHH